MEISNPEKSIQIQQLLSSSFPKVLIYQLPNPEQNCEALNENSDDGFEIGENVENICSLCTSSVSGKLTNVSNENLSQLLDMFSSGESQFLSNLCTNCVSIVHELNMTKSAIKVLEEKVQIIFV